MTRKPDWLKTRLPGGEVYQQVDRVLGRLKLNTVCASARCPNLGECWSQGTATFMILGNVCTRHCRFCAVNRGKTGLPVATDEPERIADAVRTLNLKYVVITSVDRDDLPDFGAGHFARTIQAVRTALARCEVLIPDFAAREDLLRVVIAAQPQVIAHNLETVAALTPTVRDRRAGYEQSLAALRRIKEINPAQITKSGLMLGLGETPAQVEATLRDLRQVGVDSITIGQYLRPARANLPVREYVTPERFAEYAEFARTLGFRAVLSNPLVRSSFHAAFAAAECGV